MDDEATLAARIREGDEEAFRLLSDRHAARLQRLALGLLRDPADAADAVQETLLSAWGGIPRLPDAANLGPWLTTVCLNACRQRLRKRGRERRALAAFAALPPRAPGADDAPEIPPPALLAALDGLPDREREAFLLIAIQELPTERAAHAMGCSPAAARSYLSRARLTLADRLKGFLG